MSAPETLPLTDEAQAAPFRPLGPVNAHYWRVLRMAQASGVDLAEAVAQAEISAEDWAAMVTRCRGCQWVEGCARWLARSDDDARPAPRACLNHDRFDALDGLPEGTGA